MSTQKIAIILLSSYFPITLVYLVVSRSLGFYQTDQGVTLLADILKVSLGILSGLLVGGQLQDTEKAPKN